MNKLQNANIILETADTVTNSVRAFKDLSLENILTVSAGCIHLTNMYIENNRVISLLPLI